MESIFPKNVCDNISSYIFRDKHCFSPTASLMNDMIECTVKDGILSLISNSTKMSMSFINVVYENDGKCNIKMHLELITNMKFSEYLIL